MKPSIQTSSGRKSVLRSRSPLLSSGALSSWSSLEMVLWLKSCSVLANLRHRAAMALATIRVSIGDGDLA